MKKLLWSLFLSGIILISCLPIIACKSNDLITVHDPTFRWALNDISKKLRDTKMHLILVQEFGNKDVVINAVKRNFFDNSILKYGAEFTNEIDLYDSNNNTLIDSKNQNLIANLSEIRVKAILKCFGEKKFVSFNIKVVSKQAKLMLEAEKKMNEKNIDIYVKEFHNKQLVIKGVKDSFLYKQNIINNGIELVSDFEFIDSSNSTIINDNEFWEERVITVKANFKFGNQNFILKFKIIIKQEEVFKFLGQAKSAIEISYIGLSILQNKNELIKKLKENINKQITKGITFKKYSLKVYDKNNSNIEITNENQVLIRDGYKVKVKLELEYKGETLLNEFSSKILDLNVHSLDRTILENARNKFGNILSPLVAPSEFGNLTAVVDEIKNSSFYKQIMKNEIKLFNELNLYDFDNKVSIDLKNQGLILNNKSFRVKATLKRNLEQMPIAFDIKIVSKQAKFMSEAEKKMNEKNIDIYVEEFHNKQLVIEEIKKSPVYKKNIAENGIELFFDFEFKDLSDNIIADENEFWNGRIITARSFYKFDGNYQFLEFKIKLTS